jgi:PAS domain S-box-containing protein
MQFSLWHGSPSPILKVSLFAALLFAVQLVVTLLIADASLPALLALLLIPALLVLVILLHLMAMARRADPPAQSRGSLAPGPTGSDPTQDLSYQSLVEDLPLLLCRIAPDGRLTFVNQAYCRYFGTTSAYLVGGAFAPLVYPDDRALVAARFAGLSRENPVVTCEHRVISSTGEVRWQRWIDRAIYDGERLVEYQSIGEDITEHKQAEDALRESEEKYRDLFDNATDLIKC